MYGYKLFNTEKEMYFSAAKPAANYLGIDETQFLCFYNLHLKINGWWIERPTEEQLKGKIGQTLYDWHTATTLPNGKPYDHTKPLHVLIKLIYHHINNESDLGIYLNRFIKELRERYKEQSITDNLTAEEVKSLIKEIGQKLNKNYVIPDKLLEMYEDLI